jgi:large subunit ribosomal protein L28
MARICPLTGRRPVKGNHIWRSGKAKKKGGIGTHVTAITKRRFFPNLQRVKVLLPSGEVRFIRVSAKALKAPSPQLGPDPADCPTAQVFLPFGSG